LFSTTGTLTEISTIFGTADFTPTALSGDGSIFAGITSQDQAAVFRNGEVEILSQSGARVFDVNISADGQTVVGLSGPTGEDPTIWRDGETTSFGVGLPGPFLFSGISADGSTALGPSSSGAVLHKNGTSTLLQSPRDEMFASDIVGYSLSGDGSIIVHGVIDRRDPLSQQYETYLWELDENDNYIATTLTNRLLQLGLDISVEGWKNLLAANISDDGNIIVGLGDYDEQSNIGFIIDLRPVPVPAAAWLFATALTGLMGFKRHKNKKDTY